MKLTPDLLDKGKSLRNGISNKQFKALGATNFQHGWLKKLMGTEITQSQYDEFIRLKDAHISDDKKAAILFNKGVDFIPTSTTLTRQEQYLHPNWQKLRLNILNRDKYKCVNCGENGKTLHVHHLKYAKDKMVWEVPKWYLVTLCEFCHSEEHGRDLMAKVNK